MSTGGARGPLYSHNVVRLEIANLLAQVTTLHRDAREYVRAAKSRAPEISADLDAGQLAFEEALAALMGLNEQAQANVMAVLTALES